MDGDLDTLPKILDGCYVVPMGSLVGLCIPRAKYRSLHPAACYVIDKPAADRFPSNRGDHCRIYDLDAWEIMLGILDDAEADWQLAVWDVHQQFDDSISPPLLGEMHPHYGAQWRAETLQGAGLLDVILLPPLDQRKAI